MNWCRSLADHLLNLVLPELCSFCGALKGTAPWSAAGPLLKGLRSFDAPHLCHDCFASLTPESAITKEFDFPQAEGITVMAAHWTNAELVTLIGYWKYKGVRGLVWPLAELLKPTLISCRWITDENIVWVPMPLHGRRLRERGFNQAHMLADQLAWTWGGRVLNDLVVRRRFTRQQAKLESSIDRADNLKDAFGWGKGKRSFDSQIANMTILEVLPKIILVDDVVTSGATTGSVIHLLRSGGYCVDSVVCLGVTSISSGDSACY